MYLYIARLPLRHRSIIWLLVVGSGNDPLSMPYQDSANPSQLTDQLLLLLLAGLEGVEPPLTVLETAVMPLYHRPIFVNVICSKGRDRTYEGLLDPCPINSRDHYLSGHLGAHYTRLLVPLDGIEPP